MNITINNTGNAERFGLLFQHIRLFTEHVNVTFDKDVIATDTISVN